MGKHSKIVAKLEIENKKITVSETVSKDGGEFAYDDLNGKTVVSIQKILGDIGASWSPRPPDQPTGYRKKILNSKTDILGKKVLKKKEDPSYEEVVGLLPPLEKAYTFLGEKECRRRPLPQIEWDGSIAGFLSFGLNGRHVVVDESKIQHSLLDGYLPATQFVYKDEEQKIGWEEIAFSKSYETCENAMLVFIRLKIKNLAQSPHEKNLSVFFSPFIQIGKKYKFPLIDTFYPTYTGDSINEEPEWLWVSEENDCKNGKVYPFCTLNRKCDFSAGEEKAFYLIFAYPQYLKRCSLEKIVPEINFYRALFEMKRDWDAVMDKGMKIETPEARVNNACKATLIQSFMTVIDSDVQYAAAGNYADRKDGSVPTSENLDGLPISIINAAECFSEWGFFEETKRYLTYFLRNYIDASGMSTYKEGVGMYDYGLLLYAICRCYHLSGKDNAWLKQNIVTIRNICGLIIRQREKSLKINPTGSHLHGLISSTLGDDLKTLGEEWYNYANDACCWLGLMETGKMFIESGRGKSMESMITEGNSLLETSAHYKNDIIVSLKRSINRDSKPTFIPMYPGSNKPFSTFATNDFLATYCNYGFYPHLLYANLFDSDIAAAIVDFREKRGGEILGSSRIFPKRLDNWPLAEFGWSLINLDKVRKLLLAYYSDLAHLRMQNIYTAYEQTDITDNNYSIFAGHNICSTLVTPRMTKYMLVFEERFQNLLWLNRATPKKWLEHGKTITVKNAPVRWGKISYLIESHIDKNYITADINVSVRERLSINIRFRHPENKKIKCVRINGAEWHNIDLKNELVMIPDFNEKEIKVNVNY